MKPRLFILLIFIIGITFIYPLSVFAADAEGKAAPETLKGKKGDAPQPSDPKENQNLKGLESQDQKSAAPVSMPIYQPPLRGAPGGRVGGGTRGVGDELITLFALAPNHVALTTQDQPILYWFLSNQTKHPIEVTLIIEEATQPLLEKRLSLPAHPGIHDIRLKDFNLHLSKGTQYRWFVAVVPDPDRRSKDIIAGGIIEQVEASDALRLKLSQADKRNIPSIYAESGIWYDAIMAISELIEASPKDMNLRKQRAGLLEQVGLPEVAEYELKQGGLAK